MLRPAKRGLGHAHRKIIYRATLRVLFGRINTSLGVKRVGLLRELVPSASVFAVLANPNNPYSAPDVKEIEKSIQAAGLKAVVLYAGDASEFDAAFNKLKQEQANALVVSTDGFFTLHRQELIALAARFSARISGH